MNSGDIGIIVVIAASTLFSLKQGFIKEIFGILAVVFGVVVGLYLHIPVGQMLSEKGLGSQAGHIVSFFLVFLGVFIVVGLFGRILHKFVKVVFLGWLDALLGALIGFLKGIILVCVAVGVITTYADESDRVLGSSKLSRPILKVVKTMTPAFPEDMEEAFKRKYKELTDWTDEHSE